MELSPLKDIITGDRFRFAVVCDGGKEINTTKLKTIRRLDSQFA
jgi:hypothetical protein